LRYDSADERLTPYGRSLGLIDDVFWERYHSRRDRLANLRQILELTRIKLSDPAYKTIKDDLQVSLGESFTFLQLVSRPDVALDKLFKYLPPGSNFSDLETIAADVLYSGYIKLQKSATERVYNHDGLKISDSFDYKHIGGLSQEMFERFERVRPRTFGEARVIPNITASAISNLLFYLRSHSSSAG
jgi:tRNA uridine 5-carboxymethylaminomethyl modification enzyme